MKNVKPHNEQAGGLPNPYAHSRLLTTLLENAYGPPTLKQGRLEPLDELIACILSQHTSDLNSMKAFETLKSRYASWDEVAHAPAEEIADVIRSGGLANSKSVRIKEVLNVIYAQRGEYSLDFLRTLSDTEAWQWLEALPGVGPKTAAIVLCFALFRPVVPVDTHVFRVAWRLGLIEKRLGEGKAHFALLEMVEPELAFRFHAALINHGRGACKAPKPRCSDCPITAHCAYFSSSTANQPSPLPGK